MSANKKIRLSRLTSYVGLLTKTISLKADGAIDKQAAAQLSHGRVENLSIDMDEFGGVLADLTEHQALTYGISLRGDGELMSATMWDKRGRPANVFQRNRQHFGWPAGPGILMIDHDPEGDKVWTETALRTAFYGVESQIECAAHFWRPSAGSCIYNSSTGQQLIGVRGQRIYLLIDDATQIPRVGKILVDRLWLADYGYIKISNAPSLLERTLADPSVWQAERVDFAAPAKCGPPLEQRRPAVKRLGAGDRPLDARAIKDLSEFERQKVERLKEAAKARKREELKPLLEKRIQQKSADIQAARNVDRETADAIARDAYECRRLMGHFVLISQDGEHVAVKDMLERPELWDGHRFRDPIEPDYDDDDRIAWVNLSSGSKPYLWSHAHGGMRYELCRTVDKVDVSTGILGTATEQTLEHMRNRMTYFERGNAVVVVGETGHVHPLGVYGLKQRLEQHIVFEKYDGREKKIKRTDSPDELPRRVLDMHGDRRLPSLAAVQTQPTMTPGGRLLERPGYDGETGLLLLNPTGDPWPCIPPRPSIEETRAALQRLWAPYVHFPFVDDTSRAIMLAALLTAVTRRSLPTAPAFMFQAPCSGSGKTLLASCAVELAGGAATTSLPHTDDEIRKTLVSHLRAGQPALFFDNVAGLVDSEDLNAVLTTELYEARILGHSRTSGPLPTNVLVVMTGNNAGPAGDLCRRMLVCTIDPRVSDPYNRQFDFNPRDIVRADRTRMVIDALTILSGWMASGNESMVLKSGLGSFEAWERLVRRAVVWVGKLDHEARGDMAFGFGDPIANVTSQHAEDDETESLGEVLQAWRKTGVGYKASQLFDLLRAARTGYAANDDCAWLGQALQDVIHPRVCTARGVARWLRDVKGRVVRGLRLEAQVDRATNDRTWFVRQVTGV